VDNSACEGNFHLKTDVEDFHQYYSMPDQMHLWDKWLGELASRPEWTFSPYGDAERSSQEPLVVSEFGNWGLPKLPRQLPWWFEIAFGKREVTRPKGVLERFLSFGFDKLFDSFNEMAEATQWHQFASLKYEIESIRSHMSIQGYVITGITDVHWEVNGLLDMWRNEKVYSKELSALQQLDLIMCKFTRHCFSSSEKVELPTLLSHYSNKDLSGAKVRWSADWGPGGQFAISNDIEEGSVLSLPSIQLELPEVQRPTTERLEIQLRSRNGHRISENSYDLFILPVSNFEKPASITMQPHKLEMLGSTLMRSGYSVADHTESGTLLIAAHYDRGVENHLKNGGNVLLIAASENALPSHWPIRIVTRAGTDLDGRWFSNYNWIRSDREPFASVAFSSILGFESANCAPRHVIDGFLREYQDDLLSGITFGWLNRNCALALQMKVGSGKMIVTTFRLDQDGPDPYARKVVDSLILYLTTSACNPSLTMPSGLPDRIS
jgi:hypothetical protein